MPYLGRDAQSDTSRTGKDVPGREARMYDFPPPSLTLMDAKRENPDNGGTRGAADIPVAEG